MSEQPEVQSAVAAVRNLWDKMAKDGATDSAKVDSSARAQRMRFETFLLEHDLTGKSVLDVGCGVGDFWRHLRGRNIACEYLGIDISIEMVRRSQERFPEAKFEARDLLTWSPERPFDYVVAFGIHNIRVPQGRELLENMTRRQYEVCAIAAHLSILTDRFQGFAAHIQPWHAEEIFALAAEITPYVLMRHDYLPNDFSLTLYRQPLIDRRPELVGEVR